MTRQTHSEWYKVVSALRVEQASDRANLELANRVWELLSGSTGFDVRSGRLVIETFRSAALRSDEGLTALVSAFRRLTTETGEYPRAALFDPALDYRLRQYLRAIDASPCEHLQWLIDCIDEDL